MPNFSAWSFVNGTTSFYQEVFDGPVPPTDRIAVSKKDAMRFVFGAGRACHETLVITAANAWMVE
jgi:hypothetical protein